MRSEIRVVLLGSHRRCCFLLPMLAGVLGRVLSTPSVVRAVAFVVPLVRKLKPHRCGVQHHSSFDIRLGLGLTAGAATLLGQSEDARCMPKRKERATVPAAPTAASSLASCQFRLHKRMSWHRMIHRHHTGCRSGNARCRGCYATKHFFQERRHYVARLRSFHHGSYRQ